MEYGYGESESCGEQLLTIIRNARKKNGVTRCSKHAGGISYPNHDTIPESTWVGHADPVHPVKLPERPCTLSYRTYTRYILRPISSSAFLFDEAELCEVVGRGLYCKVRSCEELD